MSRIHTNDAATATILVHYQYFNNTAKVLVHKEKIGREHRRKRGILKNVDDVCSTTTTTPQRNEERPKVVEKNDRGVNKNTVFV